MPGTASARTARPAEPTGLHVAKVTSSGFTVALSPTAHAKRYRLFASTVRSNLFVQNIANSQKSGPSSSPRVRIGGLSNSGAEYYYRVEALNGQRSKFSGTIGEVGLRPAPPAHIRATSSHAKTYVTWNGSSVSGFEVEQATDPNMGSHQKFYKVRGDSNEFTPYGLNQGRKYFFRVRAMNGSTPSTYSGTTQAVVQTAQQRVRVMTYNIKEAHFDGEHEGGDVVAPWNPDRKDAVAQLITRANPDVVGIEEGATKIGHRRHGPRQVDTLRKALGGTYGLARTEVPPSQPDTHRTGDYILYKKATWRKVGKGGHWALGNHRWAAHQVLRSRTSGAKFLFVTAHLRQQPGRSNDVLRQRETERLVHHGHQLAARKGVPVVYVGDFNSDPFGNHAYNAPAMVMKQHHIADSYNVAQKRVRARYNTANHYQRRPPHVGARIDYIFAPQGVGVRSWKLIMRMHHGEFVGTIPSDHNPVVSDLMIPYNR